jgi:hypothetical protein
MNFNQTTPFTPERHCTARCHNHRPQEMPPPQHRRIPAQPSEDDNPFAANLHAQNLHISARGHSHGQA